MRILALCILLLTVPVVCFADPSARNLTLSYSDGRAETQGVDDVNAVLRSVGVRVSVLPLPQSAAPLLKTSHTRALTPEETAKLLSLFSLHRGELLEEIRRAGRTPEAHRGGYLSTSEIDVPPYPKVYDMKALTQEIMAFLQVKFGKLHVNSADNGMGIDEVMSIVSGGPWTWFFILTLDTVLFSSTALACRALSVAPFIEQKHSAG